MFVVHSKAVAATSSVFDRLINGAMNEAQTRSAELKEVDPETFVRFLEYAYRHDYTGPLPMQETVDAAASDSSTNGFSGQVTPSPKLELSAQRPLLPQQGLQTLTGDIPNQTGWGNSNSAPSDFGALPSARVPRKQTRMQGSTRAAFNRREYLPQAPKAATFRTDPQQNHLPSQNYAPVFLAHAKLYTLAEMRMVSPLKALALHKLHNILVHFQLHPERLTDVVELARYAYEHGADRSVDGTIDPLRDMVVNFVACEKKALSKHPELRNLMDGGGEFAGDFWDIVSQELA